MADEHEPQPDEQPLSGDEYRDALAKLTVADTLVSTITMLVSLGFARVAAETRDLEQARLAIEALRALLPAVRDSLPAELVRDLEGGQASLQLAYADAVAESSAAGG